jgi:AraC family transcriptional regulator
MPVTRLLKLSDGLSVVDYRCDAVPSDTPFTEVFDGCSLSYVARGSFGCTTRGRHFELVAGSLLVGRAGDEYQCTHEHHDGGDECLSFQWSLSALDAIEVDARTWGSGALPAVGPLPLLGVLGRVQAAAHDGCGLEEVALRLAKGFSRLTSQRPPPSLSRLALRDRRRAVEAALFITAHANEPLRLAQIAALTSLSQYHFLRLFARVTGFTPHQYLVRARLLRAAELLADPSWRIGDIAFEVGFNDLSNFVRAFNRAAGMAPGSFRRLSKANRKIYQDAWQATN